MKLVENVVLSIVIDPNTLKITFHDRIHDYKLKYGEFKRLKGRKKLK